MNSKYMVVYKVYQKPEVAHFKVQAANKNEAKAEFLSARIKHDYIIKVIK